MLLLLQTAAQHLPPGLPPINITVQQPPAAPGMSEWEKTLISAGVGAPFGILSILLMEYLKPYIAKRLTMKTVGDRLAAELFQNLSAIEALCRLFKAEEIKTEQE